MSSFPALETSTEASKAIEIYSFTIGVDAYRYTTTDFPVTVAGVTYQPESILRGRVARGPEARNRPLSITVPSDNAFVSRFKVQSPGQKVGVSIFKLQKDEIPTFSTQALVFRGNLQSVAFVNRGLDAELAVRSRESAASRTMPRMTFQGPCNHQLYDLQCGAIPITVVGFCTAVVGTTITVSGANSVPDGYWTGGFAKPSAINDPRLILSHVGNQLVLLQPFGVSPLNSNVDVFAGCDHVIDGDCLTKHSRVGEYGGFPNVPTRNPFSVGLD